MKLLNKLLDHAPYLRNRYILVLIVLGALLLFIDDSNVINQWKFSSQISDLENQKEFYINSIKQLKEENDEITGTPEKIEKFAREKYLMKRPNEDIFVIIKEEE
jgi:cell division protein FtsB